MPINPDFDLKKVPLQAAVAYLISLHDNEVDWNLLGIKVLGHIDALPIPEGTYEYGDAYMVGTEKPYDMYIYSRPDGKVHTEGYWFPIGKFPMPGPQGPKGDSIETLTSIDTGTSQYATYDITDGISATYDTIINYKDNKTGESNSQTVSLNAKIPILSGKYISIDNHDSRNVKVKVDDTALTLDYYKINKGSIANVPAYSPNNGVVALPYNYQNTPSALVCRGPEGQAKFTYGIFGRWNDIDSSNVLYFSDVYSQLKVEGALSISPSTSDTGTLSFVQLETLQNQPQRRIRYKNQLYYRMDPQDSPDGIMNFIHLDVNGDYKATGKCFSVTMSTRAWKVFALGLGGSGHYTARWDKVNASMVRLNDAASFPTDITNFAHRGSVNANYSNPFDNIYPWSGIKLCNISIDLYRKLTAGDSITKCVTAWEGDKDFSYNDTNGVWRYRPEFWGKSWEDDKYRYFDVSEKAIGSYVHYPEAIVGRWHGRNETLKVGGKNTTCLVPSVGIPAKSITMNTLHTYAKNYGATLDSIYSVDADTLLCIVEFATMNTQNAIGKGVSNLYMQSYNMIKENATNSTKVKVLAESGNTCCIPGAIFDIGTSNGGNQIGSFTVVSAKPNAADAQYLDVTLDKAVTVTTANYWSIHGLANVADEAIGSKSGYIGENGKCNAYYRGIVMFGNMWFYTLGAYENKDDHHIWIANSDKEADNYDALDMTVHYDTGLVLPTAGGYTKKLGLLSRSGLLSIPVFCTETGGDSSKPVGDYFYNGPYNYNTVLLSGGYTVDGSYDGALFGNWGRNASSLGWSISARPRLKNP